MASILNKRVRIIPRPDLDKDLHNRTGIVRGYNRRTFLYRITLDRLPMHRHRSCYVYANDIEVVSDTN